MRARARPPAGDVVVVGGSGAVGRSVVGELAAAHPGRVVVAGRDLDAARRRAAAAGHGARAARVDVRRHADLPAALAGAAVVVVCVEAANADVAGAALGRGVHVVDVSATASVLDAIARLDPLAGSRGATAVLSVGLAPGVTNLLGRLAASRVPAAAGVDLTVGLGLGGDHGADSRRWVLRGLAVPPPPGATSRRVALAGWGRRTAHWFPFSDQVALTAALGVPVTTRLCFDDRAVTGALFGLRWAGVFGGPRRRRAAAVLDRTLARLPLGSDRFVVRADARAPDGASAATVTGRGEAHVTGVVAARVADRLLAGDVAPGVHHLDDIVDPAAFLGELPVTVVQDALGDRPAVEAGG